MLANGTMASIFTGLHFFFPSAFWSWLAFAASLAAVNADKWATELGGLNTTFPRLITSWKPVGCGTSGVVSIYGTLAAAGGAAFIAIPGALLGPAGQIWINLGIIVLTRLLGSMFDSLLGASVQPIYHCPHCGKETKKHPRHTCGTDMVQVRGWSWLNNDMVNLGCLLTGALIGRFLL